MAHASVYLQCRFLKAVGAGSKPALQQDRLIIPGGVGTRPYNTLLNETALVLFYSKLMNS